ncbi:class I SAM-dependent methyltransferase [Polynucleobacter sp. UB-Piko-W3]|uniref:class I SAM-dependent methyltransferase n=1 Tax=Polynucleobacter sp. UB-Piko-W3 TaxID=1819735 RepID=UPI001C0C0904|nr:class I SAM-dependent methyltransferase [Polynucleobacter sp. UB-Piko-W3]MBU3555837.1 class I SAM-dependent methyltransferase [Polynucleobacter sp. UB-Piko-W3]
MNTLTNLYDEHSGKTSDKWAIYLREYEQKFEPYQNLAIKLLEIGIQNGGSLEIYSKYFQEAKRIMGCDINPKCSNLSYDDPRIQVIVGDANQPSIKAEVLKEGQFDIIIDDGSHTSKDIVQSFCHYFPALKEGGIFIVEDLHCSYWNEFQGGLFHPISSMNFFKRLVDILNFESWGINKPADSVLKTFLLNYDAAITEDDLLKIHSIEFANSLCFIKKEHPEKNLAGKRRVVGTEAMVEPIVQGLNGQTIQALDQSRNSFSSKTLLPEEEALFLARENTKLKQEIEDLKAALKK